MGTYNSKYIMRNSAADGWGDVVASIPPRHQRNKTTAEGASFLHISYFSVLEAKYTVVPFWRLFKTAPCLK